MSINDKRKPTVWMCSSHACGAHFSAYPTRTRGDHSVADCPKCRIGKVYKVIVWTPSAFERPAEPPKPVELTTERLVKALRLARETSMTNVRIGIGGMSVPEISVGQFIHNLANYLEQPGPL